MKTNGKRWVFSLLIAGQTYTMSRSGVARTYSLSTLTGSFSSSGGPGTVNVTAPNGCSWSATSNVGWASITAGATGSGNGSVSFTVTPNAGSTTLNGTLTVAGQTYSITESGVACSFTLASNSVSLGSGSGGGSVNITAGSGCGWTATSD